MTARLIILLVWLLAAAPVAAETVTALLIKALDLACVEQPLDADAMAGALSAEARVARDGPLTMGPPYPCLGPSSYIY